MNQATSNFPRRESARRALRKLTNRATIDRIRKGTSEILTDMTQILTKKNALYDHGEFKDGLFFPYHNLTLEHFYHLLFLEEILNKKKLKILDIATGSGVFPYFARKRGHQVNATFNNDLLTKKKTLSSPGNFLDWKRAHSLQVLDIAPSHLVIETEMPIKLPKYTYDVIYINQCTLHYPDCGENRPTFWSEAQWK